MTSFNRYFAKFYTKERVNLGFDAAGNATQTIEAILQDSFRSSMIEKADDWVVAVERFEININGIPYYPQGPVLGVGAVETLTVTLIGGAAAEAPASFALNFDAFSIPDCITNLNLRATATGSVSMGATLFSIDHEGYTRITATVDWWQRYRFDFTNAPRMNRILGLNVTAEGQQAVEDGGLGYLQSKSPRWDCGDDLDHLRIDTNLPTVSDTIGQAKSSVLTDLSFGAAIGASFPYQNATGLRAATPSANYSQRQRIIYNPQERRYLNLRSSAPIDDIQVTCEYVRQNGDAAIVPLPIGASFSVKLGFFNRA